MRKFRAVSGWAAIQKREICSKDCWRRESEWILVIWAKAREGSSPMVDQAMARAERSRAGDSGF